LGKLAEIPRPRSYIGVWQKGNTQKAMEEMEGKDCAKVSPTPRALCLEVSAYMTGKLSTCDWRRVAILAA